MSETDKQTMPERQVKIYLAVLAGLLVVAVLVTVFTAYQSDELAQEEPPAGDMATEESQNAQPVQHNFMDANSQIEQAEADNNESSTPPQKAEEPTEDGEEPDITADVFDPEQDRMVWPVSGTVLMDYSPDALIYDVTLDLYRTNDSISIGAEQDEDVVAAAGGTVEDVGHSDELGNYVVLDNGNGYETTYGQLSDEAMVEIGEIVAQGEMIGRMSDPTWYSSALGTHLIFTVTVDGEAVNPLDYLENVLDD